MTGEEEKPHKLCLPDAKRLLGSGGDVRNLVLGLVWDLAHSSGPQARSAPGSEMSLTLFSSLGLGQLRVQVLPWSSLPYPQEKYGGELWAICARKPQASTGPGKPQPRNHMGPKGCSCPCSTFTSLSPVRGLRLLTSQNKHWCDKSNEDCFL